MKKASIRVAVTLAALLAGQAALAQAIVSEKEPNNSRSQAQTINPTQGVTVNGTMATTSDADYYRVSYIPGGECLVADLYPNPSSNYNLRVVNSAGVILGSSSNGSGQADFVTVCNVGGPVFVQVVYISGLTGTSGSYALTVGF